MNQWGVSPGCTTQGRKGPSPQRHKYTKECPRITPSSSQPSQILWGNHCGSDDRDCHTHNLAIALCALQRPTCPQSSAIDRHPTRQECTNSSAKTMGTSPPSGEDTPCRREVQRKEKGGGYISKGFCAKTDLCTLASPRVALVGVCLLRHPDKGNTR